MPFWFIIAIARWGCKCLRGLHETLIESPSIGLQPC